MQPQILRLQGNALYGQFDLSKIILLPMAFLLT